LLADTNSVAGEFALEFYAGVQQQGGIAVADYAATHTKVDAVRQTATGTVDEQPQEIVFMAPLLQKYGASPLPYP